MAKGPFKMKGSPMQRNFGVGSPLREEKHFLERKTTIPMEGTETKKKKKKKGEVFTVDLEHYHKSAKIVK